MKGKKQNNSNIHATLKLLKAIISVPKLSIINVYGVFFRISSDRDDFSKRQKTHNESQTENTVYLCSVFKFKLAVLYVCIYNDQKFKKI